MPMNGRSKLDLVSYAQQNRSDLWIEAALYSFATATSLLIKTKHVAQLTSVWMEDQLQS